MNDKIEINAEFWASLKSQFCDQLMLNILFNDKLNKQADTSDLIYHYTSLESAISIIETQSFFCSHINFLNDKKEYKYGVELLSDIFSRLENENFETEIIKIAKENISKIHSSERFTTCFSKEGDLLGQWRAYANNGKGLSIGFDLFKFEKSIQQKIYGKHVDYDRESQEETLKELIKQVIKFYNKFKEKVNWKEHSYEWLVASVIFEYLDGIIAPYKDNCFKDEKEYRFEYVIDGKINKKGKEEWRFRASDNLIVPYILLETKYQHLKKRYKDNPEELKISESLCLLKRLPIKEIIVGPSLDYESIKQALTELLIKHNYVEIPIIKSKIPYRI
ncbi:MAG: DUF2971 domain-containing protein [Draconibacterium sp.]